MEDLTHLQTLETWKADLFTMLEMYNRRTSGVTDKAELLTISAEFNDQITEWLRQQRRWIAYFRGEKVEPETHFAEAVVIANFGGMG